MEMSFGSRLKHAWNAFTGNAELQQPDNRADHFRYC